ncbi:replication-relaxation family protein [Nocardia sp. NPDC059229]|uniref:replication-relaxation family protein n=1 Tax=Nocardia sp. NPDC059229 TaxID=3346778 RepID=UPI0036D18BAF
MHPDGRDCRNATGRAVRFFLEYDTGTETPSTVAAKLADYQSFPTDRFGNLLFLFSDTAVAPVLVTPRLRRTGLAACNSRSRRAITANWQTPTPAIAVDARPDRFQPRRIVVDAVDIGRQGSNLRQVHRPREPRTACPSIGYASRVLSPSDRRVGTPAISASRSVPLDPPKLTW